MKITSSVRACLFGLLASLLTDGVLSADPLRVGYSDRPGWVAWQIAIQKGWFKEAGVNVKFDWFDYVDAVDAFSGGRLDGICITNGDGLTTGATGAANKAIVIGAYSNGNDVIVAKPGIDSIKDLKGKKIGVETGLQEQLLVIKALEANGLSQSDVEIVKVPTPETPKALSTGAVDAICAWQPVAGQALKALAGSKAIFSSSDVPGLIYDILAVTPDSLEERPDDWKKVAQIWYRVLAYCNDPATKSEADQIMAARFGLQPDEFATFMAGTKILTLAEAKKAFVNGPGLDSIYGSDSAANQFNVTKKLYDSPERVENYVDPTFTNSLSP